MKLAITSALDYFLPDPTDVLLQIEAAMIPEQTVEAARIDITPVQHFARVPGHDSIGDRIWLRVQGQLTVNYAATVTINRLCEDLASLEATPTHLLPGEAVDYLMPSRYCPSDEFQPFVAAEFSGLEGGALIAAMRDWISGHLAYVPGSSHSATTAIDTFVTRQGICRDFAHLLIVLARAGAIPARFASVYAPGVNPPDFHAVAEVFLGGTWYLVDPTGMATGEDCAKIGIGRDAADVAFLSSFGVAILNSQSVSVSQVA